MTCFCIHMFWSYSPSKNRFWLHGKERLGGGELVNPESYRLHCARPGEMRWAVGALVWLSSCVDKAVVWNYENEQYGVGCKA